MYTEIANDGSVTDLVIGRSVATGGATILERRGAGKLVYSHVGQTLQSLGPLKVSLVINFRVPKISRGAGKLTRTSSY